MTPRQRFNDELRAMTDRELAKELQLAIKRYRTAVIAGRDSDHYLSVMLIEREQDRRKGREVTEKPVAGVKPYRKPVVG